MVFIKCKHSSEQSQEQRGEIRFNTAGLFGVYYQSAWEVRSVFQTNMDIPTGDAGEVKWNIVEERYMSPKVVNQKPTFLQK